MIKGKVSSRSDLAVKGLKVVAVSLDGSLKKIATTTRKGRYSMQVPNGLYSVKVKIPRKKISTYSATPLSREITVESGDITKINFKVVRAP